MREEKLTQFIDFHFCTQTCLQQLENQEIGLGLIKNYWDVSPSQVFLDTCTGANSISQVLLSTCEKRNFIMFWGNFSSIRIRSQSTCWSVSANCTKPIVVHFARHRSLLLSFPQLLWIVGLHFWAAWDCYEFINAQSIQHWIAYQVYTYLSPIRSGWLWKGWSVSSSYISRQILYTDA